MKSIDYYIGIIGSIASIIGVVWTGINVRIVQKTKKEIYAKMKVVKYSESTGLYKSVLTHLKQVANKSKRPSGVNFDDIISSVSEYYENLSKVKNDIKEDGSIEFENKMSKLKKLINIARNTDRKNFEEIINIYTEIYYYVIDIESEIDKYKRQLIN